MPKQVRLFALLAPLCLLLALFFACGGDDDDDNDDDDEAVYEDGTCDGYCAKVFDCNTGYGFADEAACSSNCETMPDKDCFLTCDPTLSCGDFFDCMASCG